jgi:hypothetical protein
MSDDVTALKTFVRGFVRLNLEPVPPQLATSGKVHLDVWRSVEKQRPVGLELDHPDRVNLWLVRMNVPRGLPETIQAALKEPKNKGWTDDAGKGANTNLSSYSQFRTKRITCLSVSTIEDARFVLESLLT